MYTSLKTILKEELQKIHKSGLHKQERIITSKQGRIIECGGKKVLNFCANNYLGLSGSEKLIQAAKKALEYFKEELPKRDLVILDEVNVAVSLNLITAQEVIAAIKNLPKEKLVIFTGRGAPQEFIDAADLVTEMKDSKHPFWGGELGKSGVEF